MLDVARERGEFLILQARRCLYGVPVFAALWCFAGYVPLHSTRLWAAWMGLPLVAMTLMILYLVRQTNRPRLGMATVAALSLLPFIAFGGTTLFEGHFGRGDYFRIARGGLGAMLVPGFLCGASTAGVLIGQVAGRRRTATFFRIMAFVAALPAAASLLVCRRDLVLNPLFDEAVERVWGISSLLSAFPAIVIVCGFVSLVSRGGVDED